MNIRNSKSVHGVNLVSAFTLAVVLLATSGIGAQEGNSESQGGRLEGTWHMRVTVKDCQTGAVLRSFPGLLAFVKGGTVTQATAGQPPPLFTNGIGVWRQTGGRTYTAVIEAFAFNPAGVWIATHRFTRTIELDRDADEFTDTIKLEILDTNGNLIAPGCGSSTGRRFE